jgi:hypothetical protein
MPRSSVDGLSEPCEQPEGILRRSVVGRSSHAVKVDHDAESDVRKSDEVSFGSDTNLPTFVGGGDETRVHEPGDVVDDQSDTGPERTEPMPSTRSARLQRFATATTRIARGRMGTA